MANRRVRVGEIQRNLWRRTPRNDFVDIYQLFRRRLRRRRDQIIRADANNNKGRPKAPLGRFHRRNQNPNFPGLANNIMFDIGDHGRRACARRNISPCKTIGAVQAYASVVERTHQPYCLTCHEVQLNFIVCPNCPNAVFCRGENNGPSECWTNNRTHRFECGTNFHTMKFDNDLIVKCAIQMVFESLVKFDGPPDEPNPDHGRLQRLMDFTRGLLNPQHEFDHLVPAETNADTSKSCDYRERKKT